MFTSGQFLLEILTPRKRLCGPTTTMTPGSLTNRNYWITGP